jgi:WD40 repeat protein
MLAIGTSDGSIKIFNLKGYEQEIEQAHDHSIIWLLFAPNQGYLLSADDKNTLRLWNLRDLSMIMET